MMMMIYLVQFAYIFKPIRKFLELIELMTES